MLRGALVVLSWCSLSLFSLFSEDFLSLDFEERERLRAPSSERERERERERETTKRYTNNKREREACVNRERATALTQFALEDEQKTFDPAERLVPVPRSRALRTFWVLVGRPLGAYVRPAPG